MKVEEFRMQASLMVTSDDKLINNLNVIDDEDDQMDIVIGGGGGGTIWDGKLWFSTPKHYEIWDVP